MAIYKQEIHTASFMSFGYTRSRIIQENGPGGDAAGDPLAISDAHLPGRVSDGFHLKRIIRRSVVVVYENIDSIVGVLYPCIAGLRLRRTGKHTPGSWMLCIKPEPISAFGSDLDIVPIKQIGPEFMRPDSVGRWRCFFRKIAVEVIAIHLHEISD